MTHSIVLLVALLAMCASSAPCPPGQYRVNATYGECTDCDICLYESSDSTCSQQCRCSSDADCGSKPFFCSRHDDMHAPLCTKCERSRCTHTNVDGHPVSNSSVEGYPACSTGCTCTAHTECPAGYFCGGPGATVCRSCAEFVQVLPPGCRDTLAVDGKCPVSTTCAEALECATDDHCTGTSSYCTSNYRCASCMESNCYLPPSRRRGSENAIFEAARVPGGWCPRDCCGFAKFKASLYPYESSTVTAGGTVEIYDGEEITILLCDAEQYSGFWVIAVKGATPDSLQVHHEGDTACTVSVDPAPNADSYPRQVPIVKCETDFSYYSNPYGFALFGVSSSNGSEVKIIGFTLQASRSKASRPDSGGEGKGSDINPLLLLLLIILGAGVAAVLVLSLLTGFVVMMRDFCCYKPTPQPQPSVAVAVGEPSSSQPTGESP